MRVVESRLFCSDGSVSQSQDDSIVGTRQCRHSLAIMPIPGTLSSSSPDLLQPTTSILDFSNPSGKTAALASFTGWLQRDCFGGKLHLLSASDKPSAVTIQTGDSLKMQTAWTFLVCFFVTWHLACFFTKKCILPPLRVFNLLEFTRAVVEADCPCLHLSLLSSIPSTSTGDLTCPSIIFKYKFQAVLWVE